MYRRRDSAAKTRMARAYEDDLRRKIFEAHAKGHGSFRKLASVFGVSLGYVEKIFRQRQASGQPERVRYRPGPKSRLRPEEHRVGKEWRSRWSSYFLKRP